MIGKVQVEWIKCSIEFEYFDGFMVKASLSRAEKIAFVENEKALNQHLQYQKAML